MFMGNCTHKLDSKGRLVLPAKWRSELGAAVVLTVGLDKCVAVYSLPAWEKYLAKLAELPFAKSDARKFTRAVMGMAEEVALDAAGGVLLPPTLRAYAGLDENVSVTGVGDHLEVWNAQKWGEDCEEALTQLEALAEGVGDFGL